MGLLVNNQLKSFLSVFSVKSTSNWFHRLAAVTLGINDSASAVLVADIVLTCCDPTEAP